MALERRLHPRVAVPGIAARLCVEDGADTVRKVEIADLSLDGVRWRDAAPVDPGASVSLTFRTRRLFGRPIHLNATVVWHDNGITAAQLLPVAGRAHLDSYLRTVTRGQGGAGAMSRPSNGVATFDLLGVGLERQGAGPRVVAIASPRHAGGTSFVAAGGAASLAARGRRVLLVDADLQNPTQHLRFGARGGPGVAHLLADPRCAGAAEMVQTTACGVALLPAGAAGGATGVLTQDAFVRLAAALRALDYPIVIVDCPPVLAAPEALLISRAADDTLLTVRAGVTRERDVHEALDALARNGAAAAGVILNDFSDFAGAPLAAPGAGAGGRSPAARAEDLFAEAAAATPADHATVRP